MTTNATTAPPVVSARTDTPAKRKGPVRRFMDAFAFVITLNRRRLIIALGILAFAVATFGAVSLFRGLGSMIATAPLLAVQLSFAMLFMVVQFGALFWFLSRPRKYTVTPDDPQIGLGFENYRGQPDLLEHAKSTVRILQGIKEFELRGGEMPKGMLLSGQPGTGKTFLASCIAAEAHLPFIYIDASSMTSMFWGVDSMIVMKLFRDAKGLARRYAEPGQRGACIVFMDELDSIGVARSGMGGANMGIGAGGMMGGGRFGLNTLLNQMDSMGQHVEDRWSRKVLRWLGFIRGPVKDKPMVFVIGATNRPEVLDTALTRPGRLDRMLEVYPPDADGRRDILAFYLNQKAHDPDINVDLMVADSIGWTPIMIKTIINEALIHAHDDGRTQLTYKDWLAAADQRTLGLKQPIRQMLPEDRRALAYHEAGHAVAAYYLQPENRILKATIERSGDALGVVKRSEREERHTRHARQIETDIMVSLGSRAVEEVILGTKMTGASSDLMNASRLAMIYCAELGMGSSLLVVPASGPLSYPMPVARMADSMLQTLMDETKRLMTEKEFAVHAVAQALLQHGELIGEELEVVFETADRAHPDSPPFQRRLLTLPQLFQDPGLGAGGDWPSETQEAAAASAARPSPRPSGAAAPPVPSAAPGSAWPRYPEPDTRASRGRWSPEQG